MKRILIIGGANGIGLTIALELARRKTTEQVYVVDRESMDPAYCAGCIRFFQFDLTNDDYTFFDQFSDIDALVFTAGFGRLKLFKDISEKEIIDYFQVNTVAAIRIVHRFYDKMLSPKDFRCGIMVSIAAYLSSPFFSVYSATKAALRMFVESVNVELEKNGTTNRILNVSPGSIKGTSFSNGKTDPAQVRPLALEIIEHLESKDDLFIPQYEEVYKHVLERYHDDFRAEGRRSYDYKISSGRINQHSAQK